MRSQQVILALGLSFPICGWLVTVGFWEHGTSLHSVQMVSGLVHTCWVCQ